MMSKTVSSAPMSKHPFISADRVNQSLTANAERRFLLWLAARTPRWITSDGLTLLGLFGQIGAGLAYALSSYDFHMLLLVNLGIMVNWLGDSLDGTLARVRSEERPRFGFYVDHVVDLFGALALMSGLGCSGLVHRPVAVALLVAFLLLAGESYLATHTLGRFQLSQGVFGPTDIRIFLILGNLAALHDPSANLFGHRILLFDIGGTAGALTMFAMLLLTISRHTAQLYRAEPLRQRP